MAEKKTKKNDGPKKARKPVAKPAVSTNKAYDEVAKEPEPAPEPQAEYQGFEVVAQWKGMDKCVCGFCGQELIGVERARRHVYDEHMKATMMRSREKVSEIVDPSGQPIKTTVFEPVTEEDNG